MSPDAQYTPSRSEKRQAEQAVKRFSDPTRRRRYMNAVRGNATITRSAIATLQALLDHSDEFTKRAWPSQIRLAEMVHVSVRTIQRHLKELAEAGYLLIFGQKPIIDPATGQFRYRKTNRYYFTMRNPGSGIRKRRNPRSHLPDTDASVIDRSINHRRSSGTDGGGSFSFNKRHDRFGPRSPVMTPIPFEANTAEALSEEERRQATPTEQSRKLISTLRQRLS